MSIKVGWEIEGNVDANCAKLSVTDRSRKKMGAENFYFPHWDNGGSFLVRSAGPGSDGNCDNATDAAGEAGGQGKWREFL